MLEDVKEAIKWVTKNETLKTEGIYLLGHSLGGYLLPRLYQENPSVKGLIFMAAPVRSLDTLMPEQITYLSELDGTLSPEEQKIIDQYTAMHDLIQSDALTLETPSDQLLGIPASYWLDLKAYDPLKNLAGIDVPMLFLQGERDYQVPPSELDLWQTAAPSQAQFQRFETLNHLMMAGEGPANPDEYFVPGHISEDVLQALKTFIKSE